MSEAAIQRKQLLLDLHKRQHSPNRRIFKSVGTHEESSRPDQKPHNEWRIPLLKDRKPSIPQLDNKHPLQVEELTNVQVLLLAHSKEASALENLHLLSNEFDEKTLTVDREAERIYSTDHQPWKKPVFKKFPEKIVPQSTRVPPTYLFQEPEKSEIQTLNHIPNETPILTQSESKKQSQVTKEVQSNGRKENQIQTENSSPTQRINPLEECSYNNLAKVLKSCTISNRETPTMDKYKAVKREISKMVMTSLLSNKKPLIVQKPLFFRENSEIAPELQKLANYNSDNENIFVNEKRAVTIDRSQIGARSTSAMRFPTINSMQDQTIRQESPQVLHRCASPGPQNSTPFRINFNTEGIPGKRSASSAIFSNNFCTTQNYAQKNIGKNPSKGREIKPRSVASLQESVCDYSNFEVNKNHRNSYASVDSKEKSTSQNVIRIQSIIGGGKTPENKSSIWPNSQWRKYSPRKNTKSVITHIESKRSNLTLPLWQLIRSRNQSPDSKFFK